MNEIQKDIEYYGLCYALTDKEDLERRKGFKDKVDELKRRIRNTKSSD